MSKKSNIFFNIVLFVSTIALFVAYAIVNGNSYYDFDSTIIKVLKFVAGLLVAIFVNTLFHELGHLISGKINGFDLIEFSVFFLSLKRVKGKLRFSFSFSLNQFGKTTMVAKNTENFEKRYSKMALGGSIFPIIFLILSIPSLFLTKYISHDLFVFWAMFLPISCYYVLDNLLPMINEGEYNDGAVAYGIKHNDLPMKVCISINKIESELYNGKTPSEIDEKLYFDLPQIQEDNLYFIVLLEYRLAYYLDKSDFENAKKIVERQLSLVDYMNKGLNLSAKINALYLYCILNINKERVEDFLYEVEKYINSVNNATTIRAKLAYLFYNEKEYSSFETFYNKGLKEAGKEPLKGVSDYEKKLLGRIKKDYLKLKNK